MRKKMNEGSQSENETESRRNEEESRRFCKKKSTKTKKVKKLELEHQWRKLTES